MQKQGSKKLIRYFLDVIILSALIFVLADIAKGVFHRSVTRKIQRYFLGNVSVRAMDFEGDKLHLRDVAVDDATKTYAAYLLTVKDVEVSLPFFLPESFSSPVSRVKLKGLKLNLEQDKEKGWNIIRNIAASREKGDGRVNVPVKNIMIENGSVRLGLPINGGKFDFSCENINGWAEFGSGRLFYSADGWEKDIHHVSSSGEWDTGKKSFRSVNTLHGANMEVPVNNRLVSAVLPFFGGLDFDGLLNLDIVVSYQGGAWQDAAYLLALHEMDVADKKHDWELQGFSGNISVRGNEISGADGEGTLVIEKLIFPFDSLFVKGLFDDDKIDFPFAACRSFGGSMEAKVTYVFDKEFHSEFHLKDSDLLQVLEPYVKNPAINNGVFFLDAKVSSSSSSSDAGWVFVPAGEFFIRKGNLFKLPVFVGLFQFLDLKRPGDETADRVNARWRLDGGTLIFDELKIASKTFDFYGSGLVKPDSSVDFNFTISLNRSKLLAVPLVGDLSREVSNQILKQLVGVRVTGSLENPRFEKHSLERIPGAAVKYFFSVLKAMTSPSTEGAAVKNGKK
jgi:hypothetical protein